MITAKSVFSDMINAPVRSFRGRVEVYEGSTLALMCGCHDSLKEFTIERIGEDGKFFGFGICQKLRVNLLDRDRKINITTKNYLEVEFGIDNDYIYPYPKFNVVEVNRDEYTNELSVIAYDALYEAYAHTFADLYMTDSYNIEDVAYAISSVLGTPLKIEVEDDSFKTVYPIGANFEGTETLRDVLDAIAEATQTIYYINKDWELVFKRLDINGAAVLDINKNNYFSLDTGENKKLVAITSATELGDNITAALEDAEGVTQYVRDNEFWTLRNDIGDLVEKALAAAAGTTINQFECSWRGNFLSEIGDKMKLTTKDNQTVYSYLLNDTVSFNGGLSQDTEWHGKEELETHSNPTSLGDRLKQTYAKVDKVNRQIEMVASDVQANAAAISALQINTDSISASVTKVEKQATEAIEDINGEITTLTSKVNAQMTAEEVIFEIQKELDNGVNKVTTSTGFTFDEEGLSVEKSGSEMKTQITEDGMQVFRGDDAVLTANNIGVDAYNLHARTYLIIGQFSRIEDYADSRTGVFWIGP